MTEPAPTFQDIEDREWALRITIGRSREILDTCKIDFGQIQDGKCFIELSTNYEKLYQVLWILCQKQAETRSVTPEEFAEAFDGDVLEDAYEALIKAVILFTQRSMRTAVEKLIRTTTSAVPESMKTLEAWIDANSETVMKNVKREVEKVLSNTKTSTSGKR